MDLCWIWKEPVVNCITQNQHYSKEISTWCYRKPLLVILPPCKVSNPIWYKGWLSVTIFIKVLKQLNIQSLHKSYINDNKKFQMCLSLSLIDRGWNHDHDELFPFFSIPLLSWEISLKHPESVSLATCFFPISPSMFWWPVPSFIVPVSWCPDHFFS